MCSLLLSLSSRGDLQLMSFQTEGPDATEHICCSVPWVPQKGQLTTTQISIYESGEGKSDVSRKALLE